ncbi:hypothetical protein F5887DRAFT_498058 [Amanita rubescens]|nr:hypothetical protein F5887DRAFT_498058 [Amanita rubescens]
MSFANCGLVAVLSLSTSTVRSYFLHFASVFPRYGADRGRRHQTTLACGASCSRMDNLSCRRAYHYSFFRRDPSSWIIERSPSPCGQGQTREGGDTNKNS